MKLRLKELRQRRAESAEKNKSLGLNSVGDKRGLNNRQNPPSSDQMKKIRAMRKLYNTQMPVLQCSTCSFSAACPQFKAGYECAFLPYLNAHKVTKESDLLFYMKELVAAGMRRFQMVTIGETLSGAPPSPENSEQANLLFFQMQKLHDVMTKHKDVEVEVEGDQSIIGKLFGDSESLLGSVEDAQRKPIDVSEVQVVTEEERTSNVDPLALPSSEDPTVDPDLVADFAANVSRRADETATRIIASQAKKADLKKGKQSASIEVSTL